MTATSARQPQPRRCVLTMHEVQSIKDLVFVVGGNSESSAQKAIFEIISDGIRKATATHTNPPAPEQKPGCYAACPFDDLCANDLEKIQAIEAAAAKAAREKMLNAVLDGNAKRFCPSIDDTHYHCCDVEACIREIFKNYEESLRGAQEEQGVSER